MRAERILCWTTAVILASGCDGKDLSNPAPLLPDILASAVIGSPHNVLAALVTVWVSGADSVAVRFRQADAPSSTVTPGVVPVADSAVVPVLGLKPRAEYVLQTLAYGTGGVQIGDTLVVTTGSLPDDLPEYVAGGTDPSPGYVAFAAGMYGLVIDNAGQVVWYHRFPDGPGLNFQPQPTGRYTARPLPREAGQLATWVELDPAGNVTRTLGCSGGLQPRFHDLLVQVDHSYWILCDETKTMDLSRIGGVSAARVTGTVVQHLSASGALLFEWSPFDHFEITDLPAADRLGETVNWTHGNALDLDTDGNLLVSFRSLGEITRINSTTGRVEWRMGGLRNEFSFQDAAAPPFAGQHGVRHYGPRSFVLLDNLGNPGGTHAERYEYDAQGRTARLLGAVGSLPPVAVQLGGTTQDLPGGRTLVSYGSAGRVEEYDAAGDVVWRIESPGYVFRAQRIHSLYRPGVGTSR